MMHRRTPDIFLSPQQLDQRARVELAKTSTLRPGKLREQLLQEARQDAAMADLKRLVGEGETGAPNR